MKIGTFQVNNLLAFLKTIKMTIIFITSKNILSLTNISYSLYHKDLFQESLIKLKQIQILENGNTKSDPKNLEVLVPINRSFFGTRQ
jgi:hypothetical protein